MCENIDFTVQRLFSSATKRTEEYTPNRRPVGIDFGKEVSNCGLW